MQVISFMNMKGGVGKTTLAVNVAFALAHRHQKKVLVVDADPQFNATQYLLEGRKYLDYLKGGRGTLLDVFAPQRPGPVSTVKGRVPRGNRKKLPLTKCTCQIWIGDGSGGALDLIPSTLGLMDLEMSKRGTETRLKSYLQEKAGAYDYVVVDCPPTISIFTQAAILASDSYLVPIKPDPLSVIGLPLLERWLDEYTDDAGVKVKSIGLVFTLVRGPTPKTMTEVMEDLRGERGDEVFNGYLSESTDVAESVDAHQPVFLYKRNTKTAGQVIAITDEFLARTS